VDADFKRIQFTPDLMPSDVVGTNVFNLSDNSFKLRQGPIFTDILLADEINRTPPKTQAALLEAMQERQATMTGYRTRSARFSLSAPHRTLSSSRAHTPPGGAARPLSHEVTMGYPDANLEKEILRRFHITPGAGYEPEARIQKVINKETLIWLKKAVNRSRSRTIF